MASTRSRKPIAEDLVAKAIAQQDMRVAKRLMSDKDAIEQIRKRLPELLDKLMELALSPEAPDRLALINLIDRVLGKPKERVELEQQGEFVLNIKVRET